MATLRVTPALKEHLEYKRANTIAVQLLDCVN